MKTSVSKIILSSLKFLSVTALLAGTAFAQPFPRPLPRPIPIPRPLPLPLCRLDLAASSLDFRILSRTSTYRGQVRITGTVKNVGRLPYVSGANQQLVALYQDNHFVASAAFGNLAVGATAQVSFTRSWDASSPAEGEFPPTYKLYVSYDPDILLDSNPANDDCNSSNNVLSRSGQAINQLF